MSPLVSVVMPVFNGERFIAQAVDSILSQTFTGFEFIIIDDGSVDATPKMLADLKDPRVKVTRIGREGGPRAGIVAALNEGLRRATGRYIARMDADDVSLPTRLEKQLAFMEAHRDHAAVGCRVRWIGVAGEPIKTPILQTRTDRVEAMLLMGALSMYHPAVMMRSEAVRAAGGYRRQFQYIEDFDLFLRLLDVGHLANVDEELLLYRRHPNQTGRRRPENVKPLKDAIDAALERRGLVRVLGYPFLMPKGTESSRPTWTPRPQFVGGPRRPNGGLSVPPSDPPRPAA